MTTPPSVRQSSVKLRRGKVGEPRRRVSRHVLQGLFAVFIMLALVDGLFGHRGLFENRRLRVANERTGASLEALRDENTALREDARRLKEDPAAVEERARRDLGLMKPGEVVVILKDVTSPSPSISSKDGKAKRSPQAPAPRVPSLPKERPLSQVAADDPST